MLWHLPLYAPPGPEIRKMIQSALTIQSDNFSPRQCNSPQSILGGV